MDIATGIPAQSILLTGASGFIAAHVIRSLRAHRPGVTIVGLDIVGDGHQLCDHYYTLDIRTEDAGPVMRAHGCSVVLHLAALAKEPGYEWREYFVTNAAGTDRLLESAKESAIRRVVFTSTMMVFAAGPWRRSEIDIPDPETAYGASKAIAERSVRAWGGESAKREVRILRPGVVFGPGDWGNMRRLVHSVRRRLFAYVGRRDTVKSCIYVKDLADLIVFLVDDVGTVDTFHGVYRNETTIADVVSSVCAAAGWRRWFPVLPYGLLLLLASPFGMLDPMGRRFAIHPRRIQKLFNDTNVSADCLDALPWANRFSLEAAFRDWFHDEPSLLGERSA